MTEQEQKRVFGRIYAGDCTEIATFEGSNIPSLKQYEDKFPLTIQIIEETILNTVTVEKGATQVVEANGQKKGEGR